MYVAKGAIPVFSHRLIMGEVTWRTWSPMTCMKTPIYTIVSTWGLVTFSKFHLPKKDCLPLAALRSCGIFFVTVRRFTYEVIGKWPDMTWKWKKTITSGVNGDQSCQKSALYRKRFPRVSEKTVGSGTTPHGRPVRVNTFFMISFSVGSPKNNSSQLYLVF